MRSIRARAALAVLMGGAVPAAAAPRALLPTNLPDAFAYPAPPEGFDPLHASDQDLSAYGFPPRPNPFRSRRAYAGWAHMVGSARIRIAPVLQRTNVRHRPMMAVAGAQAPSNVGYSTNWSGDVLTNGATGFGSSSFYTMWGEFNVPIAEQAFGVCSGTDYSATWIGMDGASSGSDVVQAGTESDASCYDGSTVGTYFAWYEWYPANTVAINNFPVSPGDDIGAQLDVASPTSASVFITNETTNQFAAIRFSPPNGTHFIGNSAEWIVERPEVNNELTTLQNYVTDFMANTVAVLLNGTPEFGFGAPGIPYQAVTMLDKNNNPLSVPDILSGGSLVYHDAGAAR